MARRRPIRISTPGRIPNNKIGVDIPVGDSIDVASCTFECAIPQITVENFEKNVVIEEIRGVSYPVGSVLTFDIVCDAAAEIRLPDNPALLYIRIPTLAGDLQDLTYEKEVEIYTGIPLE